MKLYENEDDSVARNQCDEDTPERDVMISFCTHRPCCNIHNDTENKETENGGEGVSKSIKEMLR